MRSLGLMALALMLSAQAVHAQQRTFTIDKKLAAAGGKVFTAKGCNACHTIGKGVLIGPDLDGVLTRRSQSWLEKWLHDPPAMLASDSTAKALRKDYAVNMPNLSLSEQEIRALLHYMAAAGKTKTP